MMNDETENFERRLQNQPLKKIPAGWRAEILAAARDAQTACHPSPVTRHGWLTAFNRQLSTFFWPHPQAWAGLAAAWVLVFALNFAARDTAPAAVEKYSAPSPETVAELRQQRLLFAELMGATELRVADRPKNQPGRPHTQAAQILAA